MKTNDKRLDIGGNNPPISEVLADTQKALIDRIEPLADRANNLPRKIENDETLGKVGELVVDARKLVSDLDKARTEEKKPFLEGGRAVDAFFKTASERVERICSAFEKIAGDYQRDKAAEARRKADEEARKLREDEERKRLQAESAKRQTTVDRKNDEADELAAQAEEAEARAASTNHELTKVKSESGVTAGAKTDWTFDITDYEKIPLDRLRPYFQRSEVEKAIRSFVRINKGASELAGVSFREDVKATFRR